MLLVNDFARQVWAGRRAKGWSQRGLAEAAGVPQSTVARIESGTISPRVETASRLVHALGLEIALIPRLGAGVDRALIRAQLKLSPAERVLNVASGGSAIEKLRGAQRRARR